MIEILEPMKEVSLAALTVHQDDGWQNQVGIIQFYQLQEDLSSTSQYYGQNGDNKGKKSREGACNHFLNGPFILLPPVSY
jgi:hypothetical protein